jgi:histidinol-phosphate aminotransferase
MDDRAPCHGGTDAGPQPRYDFSTNANPLGPCPSVLRAVREADVTRYPDPLYTDLRAALSQHHGVEAGRIVVGAGASELILRLIRHAHGPVLVLGPTFSEYARCARIEKRELIEVQRPEAFLREQRRGAGIGFICWPNNPTGDVWPLDFLTQAAASGRAVVDLAYAALCPDGWMELAERAAANAYRLYAPNKAFGLTGLRAAYVIPPSADPSLAWLAPSWVIDPAAEAFLHACIQPAVAHWLAACRPQLASWRSDLARDLEAMGLAVRESPATFLMARVGQALAVTGQLRERGLRVRDGTSFGLPEWIRIAAAPPPVQEDLLAALRDVLSERAIARVRVST